MSNYNLNLTGAQIDAALNKVHNADITPVDGSTNVVTSDGVHEAVNNIQFANLNSNLVSTNLSSGNNNTTIPTTQAVVNHVNINSYIAANNIAYFTAPDGSRNSDGVIGGITESSDPGNFCSVNDDGNAIIISQNSICTVIFSGRFRSSTGNTGAYDIYFRVYDNPYLKDFNPIRPHQSGSTNDSDLKRITYTTGFNSIGLDRDMYASIRLDERSVGGINWKEVTITVIRHLQL